jgi:hypothetical protein
MCLDISKYIIKPIYLENSKRLIIWNGGSIYFLDKLYRLKCSYLLINNMDILVNNMKEHIKLEQMWRARDAHVQ